MKTIKEKIDYLRKKFSKEEESQDRNIDFTPMKKEEEIVMTDIDTEEAELPPRMDEEIKSIPAPAERGETKTNDDMREKRKKSFFVSGEDYEDLEQELEEMTIKLEDSKKKLDDIRKIVV